MKNSWFLVCVAIVLALFALFGFGIGYLTVNKQAAGAAYQVGYDKGKAVVIESEFPGFNGLSTVAEYIIIKKTGEYQVTYYGRLATDPEGNLILDHNSGFWIKHKEE